MSMSQSTSSCGSAPAMQTAESRVADTCVHSAIKRCAAVGIHVTYASVKALLVAEMKLGELGVHCDLIGRMLDFAKADPPHRPN